MRQMTQMAHSKGLDLGRMPNLLSNMLAQTAAKATADSQHEKHAQSQGMSQALFDAQLAPPTDSVPETLPRELQQALSKVEVAMSSDSQASQEKSQRAEQSETEMPSGQGQRDNPTTPANVTGPNTPVTSPDSASFATNLQSALEIPPPAAKQNPDEKEAALTKLVQSLPATIPAEKATQPANMTGQTVPAEPATRPEETVPAQQPPAMTVPAQPATRPEQTVPAQQPPAMTVPAQPATRPAETVPAQQPRALADNSQKMLADHAVSDAGKVLALGTLNAKTSKREWDSFMGKTKALKMPQELSAELQDDKGNLFNLWIESEKPEMQDLLKLIVKRKASKVAEFSNNSCTYKKRELEKKYSPEKAAAIVMQCKKQGMYRPDPYFPKDDEEIYYMIFEGSTLAHKNIRTDDMEAGVRYVCVHFCCGK